MSWIQTPMLTSLESIRTACVVLCFDHLTNDNAIELDLTDPDYLL